MTGRATDPPGPARRTTSVAAAVVSAAIVLLVPRTALADGQPSHGGGLDPDGTITVEIGIPGTAGSGGSGTWEAVGPGGAGGPDVVQHVWVAADSPGAGGTPLDHLCDTGPPEHALGWSYRLLTLDLAGNLLASETVCVPYDLGGEPPAPPPLPPVPSIGEIWARALSQVPPPRTGTSPPVGLVGMATDLWYDGPTEVAVAVSIGPWTVTGTARLAAVAWETDRGETAEASELPGRAGDPAARLDFEIRGSRSLTVRATWTADVVLTGPGIAGRPVPVGSARLSAGTAYAVHDVVGVLVEP
ncbi:MAG: hypothetical protein M5U14_16960 [Acidimicrobiia bacterium]|nr:hypothetical protein [Acidimicrobiia bacterium]